MGNQLSRAGLVEDWRSWACGSLAAVVCLMAQGCGGGYYYQVPQDSYGVTGRNYTYAIYNSASRLMTHPIEDLLIQIKKQKDAGTPISDVYIVSHGWNYTSDEAVANYHNYIELIDLAMKSSSMKKSRFRPYFIFVTWLSTTRPTTDLASAVLPFNLDGAIRPMTFLVDHYPLHLMTAWKQSFNAAANALGHSYPWTYVLQPWRSASDCTKQYGTDVSYEGNTLIGQDLPVSGLLFALVSAKMSIALNKPDYSRLLYCLPADEDARASIGKELKTIKIHLVGHSYGAKLVAFAGMEAIRRWVVTDRLGYSADELDPPVRRTNVTQQQWETQYEEKMDGVLNETGHGGLATRFWINNPDESKASAAINSVYDALMQAGGAPPIESLIMINPAMNPGEFWYPVDFQHTAPAGTLRLIPRKAILYSKYDYPNGTIYSVREFFMSTQIAQSYQSAQDATSDLYAHQHFPINVLGDVVSGAGYGVVSLISSVVQGSLLFVGTTLINLPGDLYYHVTENDFGGRWKDKGVVRGTVNFVDYFVPTYLPSLTFLDRDEDQQGLFRLARPALGKTGLKKLSAGRPLGINLMGLSGFDETSPDIDPQRFCEFTVRPLWEDMGDKNAVNVGTVRQQFYSFDASLVYDNKGVPEGAHSDVKSREATSCPNGDPLVEEVPVELQKRTRSFNFVFNFTQTDFVHVLGNARGQSGGAVAPDSPK